MVKKSIYETDAVKAFVDGMSAVSQRKYRFARQLLAEVGYLRYPTAEKVDGFDNLFAIRILTLGNERLFYCYEVGDLVLVLHGYAKRTKKIPQRELETALRIRDELLGGST